MVLLRRMTSFDRDTAVTLQSPGIYTTDIRDNWNVTIGPNGGYIAAIILRALLSHLDDAEKETRSITYHFLSPAEPGPARVTVSTEKLGRSFVTLTARLIQNERTAAVALATFAPPRSHFSYCDFTMPDVPSPEQIDASLHMNPAMPGHVAFRDHYDQRLAIGPTPPNRSAVAEVGGWTRFVERRPFDALAVVAISDSWYPSTMARDVPELTAPTIDHTVHLFASLPCKDLNPDDYLLVEFRTSLAQNGFLQEDGRIWKPDGTMLAQSRQMALIIPL
ncbi:MAG TPA: thioesterase family protein [Pseudomonadales bacterium]|nr:thioesterase family protein [Pseudomonadales bacterium]